MLISMANHITQDEQLAATIKDAQTHGLLPRWPERTTGRVWAQNHRPTMAAVDQALCWAISPGYGELVDYSVCRYCKRGGEACVCD